MLHNDICPSSLLWMWLTSLTLDSLVQKCWRSHWGECWGSSLWGTPPRCCGRWSRGWEWWWIVSPSSSSSNSWVRRTLCQREGKLWYAGLYQLWGHHSLWHWNVVFINCVWMVVGRIHIIIHWLVKSLFNNKVGQRIRDSDIVQFPSSVTMIFWSTLLSKIFDSKLFDPHGWRRPGSAGGGEAGRSDSGCWYCLVLSHLARTSWVHGFTV